MGSRELYEWSKQNPMVEMRPSQFTNDPFTIARNDRMCAINAALAVNITGQVASDTLMGHVLYSGIGGQVDPSASRARTAESPSSRSLHRQERHRQAASARCWRAPVWSSRAAATSITW